VGESREDPELEALLSFLKTSNGFDFGAYKRSTLRRRIEKRMQAVHAESIGQYRAVLDANPDEFVPLFDTILINVSSFFRDPDAWSTVAESVIPRVLEAKPAGAGIRVWSAGCAAGQEPYTIAMLFAEVMGIESACRRVKIYATDLDEDALDRARHARYDPRSLDAVPEALRERYFQNDGDAFVLHGGLRRSVIFGRHDLIEDQPVFHVDLLFCRNTLMYFNVNAQARILARMNQAMNDPGFLVIGSAEILWTQQRMFAPISLKHGIFEKLSQPASGRGSVRPGAATPKHEELPAVAEELDRARERQEALGAELARRGEELARSRALLSAILNSLPSGVAVVDCDMRVQIWNDRAARMWALENENVLGRSILDLEIGLPTAGLEPALRACIEGGEGEHRVLVDAEDARGRKFRCQVTGTALRHDKPELYGAILLMTEWAQ
jgi:PAS domain S-box-containing protein